MFRRASCGRKIRKKEFRQWRKTSAAPECSKFSNKQLNKAFTFTQNNSFDEDSSERLAVGFRMHGLSFLLFFGISNFLYKNLS